MNIYSKNECIRSMKETDITFISNIHRVCFPLSRSTKLGNPFLLKMYTWYLQFQPKLSFVAIIDDKVVGFVTGTLGWGGARRRFKFTFWQIILGLLHHPSLLFTSEIYEAWFNFLRGLVPFQKNLSQTLNPSIIKVTLDSIAVHPDGRGLKLGEKLIQVFEQAAEVQGAAYVALGVEKNNYSARHLYEKCGWELIFEDTIHNSANYKKDVIGTSNIFL